MYEAGIPASVGSGIAQSTYNEIRRLERSGGDVGAWADAQNEMLKAAWGPNYDARLKVTADFIRSNAKLSALMSSHPILFSSWKTFQALSQVAESQKRWASKAGR
jgi:hypothetical protein